MPSPVPPSVTPFVIDVPASEVDDLRRRLATTRWDVALDEQPERGLRRDRLESLLARWRDEYDWDAHQADLNRVPHVVTEIDGQRVHAWHARSARADATPLLMLHGWPSTFAEFRRVVEPLSAPEDPATPAFHVVAPSLPGFGFSTPTRRAGWGTTRIAAAMVELMRRLGHERYLVHGSDAGQAIAEAVATSPAREPEAVTGLHVNIGGVKLAARHARDTPADDRERLALQRFGEYTRDKSGYAFLQATRPETLGAALTDSPVGQLAWIAEKVDEWTDPEFPVDDDHILTTASLYWFTRSAASAARFYREEYRLPTPGPASAPPVRLAVPTAAAAFPHDIVPAVRRWAEEDLTIVQWTDMPSGAHFAALERPDLQVDSLRRFAATTSTAAGRA